MATQDELKRIAAEKAVEFVPENEYIGIGTGSTINFFIEALGKSGKKIKGAVSTSKKSSELLARYDIPVVSLNEVSGLAVYIDGADEVNHALQMIKGGGGAHLNEKIVASASEKFVCIADESKYVSRLGKFPLPVEVVEIVDVHGLNIDQPLTMEDEINKITGVLENGIFARDAADVLILGTAAGAKVIYPCQG